MICKIYYDLIIYNEYEAECGHNFHTDCLKYYALNLCQPVKIVFL